MGRLRLRPSPLWVLGIATAVAVVLSAACDVGDAICTDKTVDEDRNDDCPYGPPGGPQREQAEGCQVSFDKTGCTKTFRDDVFPILMAPNSGEQSGGGCVLSACHGPAGTGSIEIVLPDTSTPDQLYALLAAYQNDAGHPYWGADAANAYFLCNVKATIGGGSAMPPTAGLTDSATSTEDDDDLAVIEEWVRCGMALDGIGSGGGGVGGAGVGGANVGGAGGGI